MQPSIFSQTKQDLQQLLSSWNEPRYRQNQLLDWIFSKRIIDFEQMTNIPQKTRKTLQEYFDCELPPIVSKLDAPDGSTKLLLKNKKNMTYECVILRYPKRTSLCVSSQIGCRQACNFCQTGQLGFFKQLQCEDIIAQFLLAQQIVRKEDRNISHIVFMGMGEPLDNFIPVTKAIALLTSEEHYGISYKRVTLSTVGLAPKIDELADQVRVSLAVSLHACRDSLRSMLMPVNKRIPLSQLKKSLIDYQRKTQQKITIEYILIHQTNCGIQEAKELVQFLSGLKAKVNLIPFNSHPGLPYQKPSDDEIRKFQLYLSQRSIPAPVRYSKGLEVSAACGQLAAKSQERLFKKPDRSVVLMKKTNEISKAANL